MRLFFFILRLKIVTETTKNACAYFSKCSTKILPFQLCPVPKCVFSVFNFRINLKTQSIYILRCWGLQFNWFVSIVSSQPSQFCSALETSGSDKFNTFKSQIQTHYIYYINVNTLHFFFLLFFYLLINCKWSVHADAQSS